MKTEPTGSQIFWFSISVGFFVYSFLFLYNLSTNTEFDKQNVIIYYSITLFGVCFIHMNSSNSNNAFAFFNPLYWIIYLFGFLVKQVQKFNKFLDKLFD